MSDPAFSHPPGLDLLLQQIAQAHASPDHDSLTEASIIASVDYLQQLPIELHWLCNSSPLLAVVVQAVQLWGYGEPPAQETLAKFKPILSAALSRCPDCAVEWHVAVRRELKRVFLEVYSYDEGSTGDFYVALDIWDADRVSVSLENALRMAERIPMAWKHIEVKGPIIECLADPTLLLNGLVFKRWKELFLKLDKIPAGVGEKWLPGAFVLLFDPDSRIREFGEHIFKKRKRKISDMEFDADFRKPLADLLRREVQQVSSPVILVTLGTLTEFRGSN
jgi:SEN1 N terminal